MKSALVFAGLAQVAAVAPVERVTYNCPGSAARSYAYMEVTAVASSVTCQQVHDEMVGRASGEGGWVDPHNGGIYDVLSDGSSVIQTSRTSNPGTAVGGKAYEDLQTFVLSDASHGCQIMSCSESQTSSFSDFSTNYCDIRNLYCGTSDGCTPFEYDFTTQEKSHKKSPGAGHDFSGCVVTSSVVV